RCDQVVDHEHVDREVGTVLAVGLLPDVDLEDGPVADADGDERGGVIGAAAIEAQRDLVPLLEDGAWDPLAGVPLAGRDECILSGDDLVVVEAAGPRQGSTRVENLSHGPGYVQPERIAPDLGQHYGNDVLGERG